MVVADQLINLFLTSFSVESWSEATASKSLQKGPFTLFFIKEKVENPAVPKFFSVKLERI